MPLPFPPLYAILDVAAVDSEAKIPEALTEGGVRLIQLRDKSASARMIFAIPKSSTRRVRPLLPLATMMFAGLMSR